MDEDGNEEEREAGGLSADTTDKEKRNMNDEIKFISNHQIT